MGMSADGEAELPKGFSLEEQVDRMCGFANRANLAAIDAVMRVIPRGRIGSQEAALEAAVAARRIVASAGDFKAAMTIKPT